MRYISFLFVFSFFSFSAIAQQCNPSIQPSSHWKTLFDQSQNTIIPGETYTYLEYAESLSGSGYSLEMYSLAYYIDAYATMYNLTDDTYYLDTALGFIDKVISTAQIVSEIPNIGIEISAFHLDDSQDYWGWVHNNSSYVRESSLNESYMFRYVTKLLRIMKEKNINESSSYDSVYNSILSFTEINIWKKWNERTWQNFHKRFVFPERTHMAAHWAYMAANMYFISDQEKCEYIDVFNTISYNGYPSGSIYNGNNVTGASLRNQNPLSNAYPSFSWINSSWDNVPTELNVMQDVSHANNVIAFIDEAHLLGMHWSRSDIEDLIQFTKDVVFDNPDGFNDCFNPSTINCNNGNSALGRGDYQADGWIKLGKYDCELQSRYENELNIMLANFPHLSVLNTYAQLGLNAKYLLNPENDNRFSDAPLPFNSHYVTAGNFSRTNTGDEISILNYKNNRTFKADMWFMGNNDVISYDSNWWSSLDIENTYNYEKVKEAVSGDFDGDGDEDIAMFYEYTNNAQIHMLKSNNMDSFIETGSATLAWNSPAGFDISNIKGLTVSGDFDDDGKDEIVIMYNENNGHVLKFHLFNYNNGSFTLSNVGYTGGGFFVDRARGRIVAGNFNNNDRDELAVAYDFGNSTGLYRTRIYVLNLIPSETHFNYSLFWESGITNNFDANKFTGRMVSGDFFSTGHDDISILYDISNGHSRMLSFISTGTNFNPSEGYAYTKWISPNNFNANDYKIVAGDLNNIGKEDIALVYNPTNTELKIKKLISNGLNFIPSSGDNDDFSWDCNQYSPASTFRTALVDGGAETININSELEKSYIIYPNPVEDVLYIKTSDSKLKINYVNIYDLNGRLVLNRLERQSLVTIKADVLLSGIYFVEFEIGGKLYYEKVLK